MAFLGIDWADVAPIIEGHCAGCHQPGAVSGVSLATYDEVRVASGVVRNALLNHAMPPWFAAAGDVAFSNDRSLSDAERDIVVAWADAGAPLGIGDPDATLVGTPPSTLDRVDHVLTMSASYTPDFTEGNDDTRCFLIDAVLPRWITGAEIVPGNTSAVHHIKLSRLEPSSRSAARAANNEDPEPGFDCENDTLSQTRIATWAPGQDPIALPEGSGLPLGGTGTYLLAVHYSASSWDGEPDLSAVSLRVEDTVARAAAVLKVSVRTVGAIAVAAGAMDQAASSSATLEHMTQDVDLDFEGGVMLHSVLQHMHVYGRSGTLSLRQGDTETLLLDIPMWSFDWQLEYLLAEPMLLPLDAVLQVECRYDNPGDSDIRFGPASSDEMCGAEFLVTEL